MGPFYDSLTRIVYALLTYSTMQYDSPQANKLVTKTVHFKVRYLKDWSDLVFACGQ